MKRLFLLNRCLEQVNEIIEQFRKDGVVHEAYAADRQRSVEEMRADLSHALPWNAAPERIGGMREDGGTK